MNKKIEVWVDGGVSKKNPKDSRGKGRYGFVAKRGELVLLRNAKTEDDMTNNEAEMKAIIEAMEYVRIYQENTSNAVEEVIIYSDSNDAICWIDGTFACRASNIQPLLGKILLKREQLANLNMKSTFVKIGRGFNQAHDLVGF